MRKTALLLCIIMLFSGCAKAPEKGPGVSPSPAPSAPPALESPAPEAQENMMTAGNFAFPQALLQGRIPSALSPVGFPPMPGHLPVLLNEELLMESGQ